MIITYFGKQFFKVQQGDTVVAFNPIGKDSDAKTSRFGAQVVLSTTRHPDYNGLEMVSYGDTMPVVIDGPGDYETQDIFIKGVGVPIELGKKQFISTIFSLAIDGISIVFLGPLNRNLTAPERDGIERPDILFVPVGKDIIDPATASKIAVSLEPKLIIPMDYDDASLKAFLKEAAEDNVAPIDKLVIKRKDLDGKEGDVVVLAY